MGDIRKEVKILHAFDVGEVLKPSEIAERNGMEALDVGRQIKELVKGERPLLRKASDKDNTYLLTTEGLAYLEANKQVLAAEDETPPAPPPVAGEPAAEPPPASAPGGGKPPASTKAPAKPAALPDEMLVPTQADVFRKIGKQLSIGEAKGDTKLDAVVNYLRATADFNDPTSLWNGLSDMGLPKDVKVRWLKMFLTNAGMPVPSELGELFGKNEKNDKIASDEPGSTTRKPTRFNVANGQIIGDPDGDYTFSEAIKVIAAHKGASPEQSESLAVALANMAPNMVNTMMSTIAPLLAGGGGEESSPTMTLLLKLIENMTLNKGAAEVESLRAEIRALSQNPQQGQAFQMLQQTIETLKEQLHAQQMESLQSKFENTTAALMSEIRNLHAQVISIAQGNAAASRLGVVEKVVTGAIQEAKDLRSNLVPIVTNMMSGNNPPRNLGAAAKQLAGDGIEKGVKAVEKAAALEDKLFFKTP